MPQSNFFSHGTKNEQYFHEDLIVESLHIYGQNFYYIPRTLIGKDEILGEDRLSKFKSAYQIEMYLENVDGFEGQGAFIQKFGMMMEQSATLVVARRRWDQLVGRYDQTIIPTRPCEGDLIYFPLSKAMFEIKFVKHQDPFYQLGKLYVYKLQVELFQYASERIDTGIQDVDVFETLNTFSTNTTRNPNGEITSITMVNQGANYMSVPDVTFVSSSGRGATATAVLDEDLHKVTGITITNPGSGYQTPPIVNITGGGGINALATATIDINIDKTDSFGDNNKFKTQAADVLFSAANPFGEVDTINNP